jgi:hypothetical protein
MTGIGRMIIAKSVTMFMPALVLEELLVPSVHLEDGESIQPHRELINTLGVFPSTS